MFSFSVYMHIYAVFFIFQVARKVEKFAKKYFAAQVLAARLFHSEESRAEVMQEVERSWTYQHSEQFRKVVKLDAPKLQQWVRASFLCDSSMSAALKTFVGTVVKPALACAVGSVPQQMESIIARFTAVIAGGAADEEDIVNLRLATSLVKGEMSGHPLIQGLMLQCRRLLQRQSEGKSMRGRRDGQTTSREHALIADAGLTLALHAGNSALAKEFGISASGCRINVSELKLHSLPQPALALNWPEVISENFLLCDQRYLKPPTFPKRALVRFCSFEYVPAVF